MFSRIVALSRSMPAKVYRELRRTHSTASSAAPAALWGLGRLNHVAIVTPNLEQARDMYRDVLGAKVSDITPLQEHGVYTVFVELPNSKIELLHPLGKESPVQAFLDKNKSGGIHHICIEVDDIDVAIAELTKRKVRVLGGGKPKIGAHGLPVVFLHPKDCGGVLIELELTSSGVKK
ncbi:putative Methylmalonyl-CoA epimerase, mitochondrial [Hypsibius exemplaris]|uniref:Methylmalonyl-CoA epimerase, mitochondrial n=1 Tax=Hypsibius exemplaris TaxID=2072580 RepID=A0A9X6NF99_HYPEX|nr:putative Methylmalonyl-CoA epimerase, mitochondrial [Hypsibius exemplaris]